MTLRIQSAFRAGLLLAVLVSVSDTMAADAELKVALSATSDAENSGTYVWARAFSQELADSGIESSIFANSSLGREIVRSEQILLGLLEVNVCGTQEVEPFTDLMTAVQLPFLFEDENELDRLLDESDFLELVNEKSLGYGMRVIDFVYLGGMTGLFTARDAIRNVADVQSFRMRAMTSEQLDYFAAWGGSGAQVAWEEVPQALQTGIVDGYMNPPIVAVLFGHGGQLDYFTDLGMSPSMRVVVVSESWYQGLDDVNRTIVQRAFRKAREANRSWARGAEERDFRLLEGVGIEVIRLSSEERDAFRQKLLPLYLTQTTPDALLTIRRFLDDLREPE